MDKITNIGILEQFRRIETDNDKKYFLKSILFCEEYSGKIIDILSTVLHPYDIVNLWENSVLCSGFHTLYGPSYEEPYGHYDYKELYYLKDFKKETWEKKDDILSDNIEIGYLVKAKPEVSDYDRHCPYFWMVHYLIDGEINFEDIMNFYKDAQWIVDSIPPDSKYLQIPRAILMVWAWKSEIKKAWKQIEDYGRSYLLPSNIRGHLENGYINFVPLEIFDLLDIEEYNPQICPHTNFPIVCSQGDACTKTNPLD